MIRIDKESAIREQDFEKAASLRDEEKQAKKRFDELLECDELNNVQILKRQEVGLLVTQPVQTAPVPQAPVTPAVPAVPAPPVSQERPSLLDGLDLDKLDLDGNTGENEVQSLLLRR